MFRAKFYNSLASHAIKFDIFDILEKEGLQDKA